MKKQVGNTVVESSGGESSGHPNHAVNCIISCTYVLCILCTILSFNCIILYTYYYVLNLHNVFIVHNNVLMYLFNAYLFTRETAELCRANK